MQGHVGDDPWRRSSLPAVLAGRDAEEANSAGALEVWRMDGDGRAPCPTNNGRGDWGDGGGNGEEVRRNDPKFACRIEIIVNSYFSIIDGKKMYNKGRTVSWVVDSEEYAIIDLEMDIALYFTWASNQKANFWVVDSKLNVTCRLATDGQLLDLIRGSQVVKLFMVVGAFGEGNVGSETSNAVGEGTSVAANEVAEGTSAAANVAEEGKKAAANVFEEEIKVEGFTWAEVPEYGETTAGPAMAEEEEKEHFMTFGCDPHGDEPAGENEEWRYFKKVDGAVHDA
ncbi:hypothetical protein ACQ4PT_037823 [Festuca glaucescens]